jgi:hypothetical protein
MSGVAIVGGRQDLFSQRVDERFWEGEASLWDAKRECSHLKREGD